MSTDWPDFNDLWDYSDPAGTEVKFRAVMAEGERVGDQNYHLQLLTQIARTYSLRKMFDDAHQLLDRVQKLMEGRDIVEVRYLLERGRTFNSAGDPEEAVGLFKRALALGQTIGATFYVIDALHMLGIAAVPEDRMEWNLKAIEFAEQAADRRSQNWLGSLYNNTGWTLFDEENYEKALELFEKCQAHFESRELPDRARIAKWSMGRTLRALGRLDEALACQRELEQDPDHDGFVVEEIAEVLYTMKKSDEAKPYFAKAYDALSQIDWVAEDVERMERLKRLSE